MHEPGAGPAAVSALIGRTREREALGRLLETVRMLTVLGPGGTGKSRLVEQVAGDAASRFADGVAELDLEPMADARGLTAAVAAAVSVRERPGRPLPETLVDAIASRRLLLVLDGCERHTAEAAGLAALLIAHCPHVRVLVTSRLALGVDGEVTYLLPPLSVPPPTARTAAEVEAAGAARLFEARAQAVDRTFRLTDATAPAVGEICRRLDGMPLALELAAARAGELGLDGILAGLADPFQLLRAAAEGMPRRQRTLEASVEWSLRLLDDEQRRALARLSVFAGSFTPELASSLLADDGDRVAARRTVAELARRGLVQVVPSIAGTRHRLLEAVRLHARRRLDETDDADRIRDRHLDVHLGLAARARAGLNGTRPDHWHARLDLELDDLRAAMDWALATERPGAALDLLESTFAAWFERGRYSEMLGRLDAVATATVAEDTERARAFTTGALLTMGGGDLAASHRLATRAVPLARSTEQTELLLRCLTYRAWSGFHTGWASAGEIASDREEALSLAEAWGHEKALARVTTLVGYLVLCGSSLDEGSRLLERAIAVCEAAGLTYQLASANSFLGLWPVFAGDLGRARRHARITLELDQDTQRPGVAAHAHVGLALADLVEGQAASALRHLERARTAARSSGLAAFECIGDRWWALAVARAEGPAAARPSAEAARAEAHGHGSRLDETAAAWLLGELALHEDRRDEARHWLEAACEGSREPGYPFSLGRSLLALARLARAEGDAGTAWVQAHEGLEVLVAHGDRIGAAEGLATVADAAVVTGRVEQGLRLLGAAEEFHGRTGTGPLLPGRSSPDPLGTLAEVTSSIDTDSLRAQGRELSLEDAVIYARRGRGDRDRPGIGWDALTPTEWELVRLVAHGHTNAQIGQRLFISPNTVKKHLSSVYAKVGVDGRPALISEAVRREP